VSPGQATRWIRVHAMTRAGRSAREIGERIGIAERSVCRIRRALRTRPGELDTAQRSVDEWTPGRIRCRYCGVSKPERLFPENGVRCTACRSAQKRARRAA
jgi:hypothetical protein